MLLIIPFGTLVSVAPRRGCSSLSKKAFSLIEIVVVITILITLSLIALSFSGRLIDRGHAVTCAAQLRTYGIAVQTLFADRGRLPEHSPNSDPDLDIRGDFHKWLVTDYLSEGMKCPTAKTNKRKATYAGNLLLCQYFPTLTGIPAPASRVVLAAEREYPSGFTSATHFNMTIWGATESQVKGDREANEGKAQTPQYHGTREKRGLHFYFLDGHIELVYPIDNDFFLAPVLGNATNGGYFYHNAQFERMSRGVLVVH